MMKFESFEGTRKAGAIAADFGRVKFNDKAWVTTEVIDKFCYEYINDNGAYSAPLFYRGFQNLAARLQTTLYATGYHKINFWGMVI